MHSLKNTVIAVGLLGLSFLFYQASSNKSPVTDDMIPALEISEGGFEPPTFDKIDAPDLEPNSLSKIEQPKIGLPGAIEPKQIANGSSDNDFSKSSGLSHRQEPGKSTGGFAPNATPDKQLPPSELSDNGARDDRLIEALKTQQQLTTQDQFSPTQPPTERGFETPAPDDDVSSQFISQSIPSSDSSYNAMANDSSKNSGADVMRADAEPEISSLNLQAAWPHVDRLIAEENYRDALRLLSGYYRTTDLTGPQRQRLIGFLDALAGKVIYSSEHHLAEGPYTVGDESLSEIGINWKVPAQLIYNINQNQISNVDQIASGTQLKMVRGPFDAEIDTEQNIMTLFLDDLYAGRYTIRLGVSGNPKPGDFRVVVKAPEGHSWRDAQGNSYPPEAPENGYGPNWIGLSGSLCIHSIDESTTDGHRGCIGLSANDAKDVFAILSVGSKVRILR